MNIRALRAAGAGVLLAFSTAAAIASEPTGEFFGMTKVRTPAGDRSLAVKCFVQRPMTMEDAQPLKKVLEQQGQQGLVNAIRGSNRGYFDLGGITYPIDLVVAEPIKDGWRYYVVTTRALRYEEVQEGSASLDNPFTVAVFDALDFGVGSGQLFTKAALTVDVEGHVRVARYGAAGSISEVKRR